MCVVLFVNHITCTHTTSIWQHCVKATHSSTPGIEPCCSPERHGRAILTRNMCEACSVERVFARRDGIAGRGWQAPLASLKEAVRQSDEDDADDSGYHSDIIYEEDESSDIEDFSGYHSDLISEEDEFFVVDSHGGYHSDFIHQAEEGLKTDDRALSFTTTTSSTKMQWHRMRKAYQNQYPNNGTSLHRKPSRHPDLKFNVYKNSINTFHKQTGHMTTDGIGNSFPGSARESSEMKMDAIPKPAFTLSNASVSAPNSAPPTICKRLQKRVSTLLHPSSPSAKTDQDVRGLQSFPFSITEEPVPTPPQEVQTNISLAIPYPTTPIAVSTLPTTTPTHTQSPIRPSPPERKDSSLLHPSCPSFDALPVAQYKTIISVPPRQCRTGTSTKAPPTAIQDRLVSWNNIINLQIDNDDVAHGEFGTTETERLRRESILHSCLSDGEDERRGVRVR